ncbi:MAG: type IV pilus modification PilV family protein [Thermoanaerobaculia bacterium]
MKNTSLQRGYNLVEVMIAMGLLSVVMLSVLTLFFFGRQNVYSGKQMTRAVAVGTRVMEDLSSINKRSIYLGAFNIADNAVGANVTIAGRTYANSRLRSTDATVIPSPPADIATQTAGGPMFLTDWTAQMGTDLRDGSVSVVLTPLEDPTNSPAQFRTATLLKIRVIVQWDEGLRRRNIVLDTVKPF